MSMNSTNPPSTMSNRLDIGDYMTCEEMINRVLVTGLEKAIEAPNEWLDEINNFFMARMECYPDPRHANFRKYDQTPPPDLHRVLASKVDWAVERLQIFHRENSKFGKNWKTYLKMSIIEDRRREFGDEDKKTKILADLRISDEHLALARRSLTPDIDLPEEEDSTNEGSDEFEVESVDEQEASGELDLGPGNEPEHQ